MSKDDKKTQGDPNMEKPGFSGGGRSPSLYAWVSLGAFACCLVVLLLLIGNESNLASFGLVERIYYVVLVLMGLVAAVFLFGVIPSSATYEGRLLGGRLRLGGAIVGAALVVVGGYFFAPQAWTFPLTVYVHGPGGPRDIPLRNAGSVVLELGPESKRAQIGESGQAYFPAIPENLRGQPVPAWVESETYQSVGPSKSRLDSSVLYLQIEVKLRHYQLAGTISDETGRPLPDVRVSLPAYQVSRQTNADGRFELDVPAPDSRGVDLVAEKPGYEVARFSPTLGDTALSFALRLHH